MQLPNRERAGGRSSRERTAGSPKQRTEDVRLAVQADDGRNDGQQCSIYIGTRTPTALTHTENCNSRPQKNLVRKGGGGKILEAIE